LRFGFIINLSKRIHSVTHGFKYFLSILSEHACTPIANYLRQFEKKMKKKEKEKGEKEKRNRKRRGKHLACTSSRLNCVVDFGRFSR